MSKSTHHRDRLPALTSRLRARYPLVSLVHSDEADALRWLAEAAAQAELELVTVRYGDADPAPLAALALTELVARPPSVLALPWGHRLLEDLGFVRLLAETLIELERAGHVVVLHGPAAPPCPELDRDRVILTLPLPGPGELGPLCAAALRGPDGAEPHPDDLQATVQALAGLTTGQARRALRRLRGRLPRDLAELRAEKRDLVAQGGLLDLVTEVPGLADLGGLDELKDWLLRRRAAFSAEARAFGLPAPRGVLVVGVQGCGKSVACKAAASALGLPLVRLDLGRLHAGGLGPDANLRHALQIAEAMAPCVLWLDELDKAFAHALTGGSETGARMLGSLLTWLGEQRGVFVAASANRVDHLPAELLRKGRFDETFFVDVPDVTVRAEILAVHLRHSGRDPAGYDVPRLAKAAERLTGAEIEQALLEALAQAFAEARELAEADLLGALSKTVPLVETYEPQVKALREWARRRCRPAQRDRSLRDLYEGALASRKEPL